MSRFGSSDFPATKRALPASSFASASSGVCAAACPANAGLAAPAPITPAAAAAPAHASQVRRFMAAAFLEAAGVEQPQSLLVHI
jgi:hypothetical protein